MPKRWNAAHDAFFARHGRRQRVFCASLADVFDNAVSPSWRADLFALVEATPHLDWLLLTKRIGNVATLMKEVASHLFWLDTLDTVRLPPNVWLGATVVNQEEADRDIPKLLAVPTRVRFLSMEPLLGPVTLFDLDGPIDVPHGSRSPLHWVIVGGESGKAARPMHLDWAQSLRDQCAAAGVPFLFKQWGEWAPVHDLRAREHGNIGKRWINFDPDTSVCRLGKVAAGRKLDGVTLDAFPDLG
jgi:protein gp37